MKHSRFVLKFTLFFSVIFASAVITSCQSVPKDIPTDLTAREIVQKAQNASNNGNNKAAEVYYKTLLERYGMDTSIYIEANFEIAHLCIKQKRYEEATSRLNDILSIYESSAPGELPAQFKKLASIDMAKIPDSYKTAE